VKARDQVNPGRWGGGRNRSTMPLRDTVRKELVDLTKLEGLMADDRGRDMLDVLNGMCLFELDMSGGLDSQSQDPDSCLGRTKPVSMSHSQGAFYKCVAVLILSFDLFLCHVRRGLEVVQDRLCDLRCV
jgi:hypothetical protein